MRSKQSNKIVSVLWKVFHEKTLWSETAFNFIFRNGITAPARLKKKNLSRGYAKAAKIESLANTIFYIIRNIQWMLAEEGSYGNRSIETKLNRKVSDRAVWCSVEFWLPVKVESYFSQTVGSRFQQAIYYWKPTLQTFDLSDYDVGNPTQILLIWTDATGKKSDTTSWKFRNRSLLYRTYTFLFNYPGK